MSDAGIPQIAWNSATALSIYGAYIDLNGFRVRGNYSKNSTRVLPFTPQISPGFFTANIASNMEGFADSSSLPTVADEMWVAVFAAAAAADTNAKIVIIPYLKVTAYNSSTNVLTVASSVKFPTTKNLKEMISGYFVNGEALICSANGAISNQVVNVTANTATTLTISGNPNNTYLPSSFFSPTAPAVDYDYILLAPRGVSLATYDYKYLTSLKFDYTPPTPGYEWRNFAISGRNTYSYTGDVFGAFTNTSYGTVFNFRDQVSPLATGVIGSIQAYNSAANTSAYSYLSHDAANTISTQGVDRTGNVNDGGTSNFSAAFKPNKQWLYAMVDQATTTGKIVIRGWIEA